MSAGSLSAGTLHDSMSDIASLVSQLAIEERLGDSTLWVLAGITAKAQNFIEDNDGLRSASPQFHGPFWKSRSLLLALVWRFDSEMAQYPSYQDVVEGFS